MGTIQTFQVLENGISKPVFYAYVKDRGLDQVAHGVYVSPDTWTDAIYILHLRCSQAVFSHETALFFHDLTDREPLKYSITVKTGYNPSRLQEDGFQVYTVKKDLHDIGLTTMQTSFGHSVPVYDMERTICDLLRSRKNIEMQVFQDALKQYAKRKDKNLRMLMKYATMFHVEKILRPYLEVLLSKDVLWDALVATAKKRGTLEQIEAEEIGEVFDEIQSSPVMENLWKAYQRNYSYADDLSWHTVMDAVRVLYQTVYAEGNGTHD